MTEHSSFPWRSKRRRVYTKRIWLMQVLSSFVFLDTTGLSNPRARPDPVIDPPQADVELDVLFAPYGHRSFSTVVETHPGGTI